VNGVHDMGGMHGFGPVERDEAIFHGDWEKRVSAMHHVMAVHGRWNIDEFRHGIERIEPARYLAAGYYERWLATLETNLVEKGIVTADEIEAMVGRLAEPMGDVTDAAAGAPAVPAPTRHDPELAREAVRRRLARGTPPRKEGATTRFSAGDTVITRNVHPRGHTRLPRYARGKCGVIDRFHGVDVLPDASAHGRGPSPEPLYSVRFDAAELWGEAAEHKHAVYIDLWESYLEPRAP
jgi:nitrile hydratase beta subunit